MFSEVISNFPFMIMALLDEFNWWRSDLFSCLFIIMKFLYLMCRSIFLILPPEERCVISVREFNQNVNSWTLMWNLALELRKKKEDKVKVCNPELETRPMRILNPNIWTFKSFYLLIYFNFFPSTYHHLLNAHFVPVPVGEHWGYTDDSNGSWIEFTSSRKMNNFIVAIMLSKSPDRDNEDCSRTMQHE